MMSIGRILVLAMAALSLSGCLTRIVTMPMRVVGAVATVIPGAGDATDSAISAAARTIDETVPLP
jgi:hypothetical protein